MGQAQSTRGTRARRVGERVLRYREELGWTQRQLAAKAQLSVDTVSRVERGLERPVLRTVQVLASAFGVSAEQLLGLAGQPTLFPLPDERRMSVIRRVLALSDDEIERAWPRLDEALARAGDPTPTRAPRARRRTEPAEGTAG